MITLNVWVYALVLLAVFTLGGIAEWVRKEDKKIRDIQNAYAAGYRFGYDCAEFKFGPARPEPEDFENWPPIACPHIAYKRASSGPDGKLPNRICLDCGKDLDA